MLHPAYVLLIWQVATALAKLWDESKGAAWLSASLNGEPLKMWSGHGWPASMPKEGLLKVGIRTC